MLLDAMILKEHDDVTVIANRAHLAQGALLALWNTDPLKLLARLDHDGDLMQLLAGCLWSLDGRGVRVRAHHSSTATQQPEEQKKTARDFEPRLQIHHLLTRISFIQ